ncbi:MarR family winged helix-turn-helix transcriptional regulator [Phaeobacter sp. C3_T13_0]|uniref:MarR family winged helix-turn-helix transcriptional regulator n=1 Tax=Phaeobacter cretensis TaxID=3342641 RepID=UPI0039BC953A
MIKPPISKSERIKARRAREDVNIFSRMPAAYAASRSQAAKFLQRAGGLSVVEWRVLWDLTEAGPLSIREMASIQRVDHSQLSRALPGMRQKGFVTMERDEIDGRQMNVTLTDAGQAAYAQTAPIMKQRREGLRRAFTAEELQQFAAFIDRFEDFLRLPVDELLEEEKDQ